jgi:peptidoglycan hydrolase-like protein with peptidoglycan-binding domain
MLETIASRRRRSALAAALLAFGVAACSIPTDEDRAKAAEESAKKSLIAIDHEALSQTIEPEKVKQIQEQLAAINEYKGEINGKLDQVTINAYEAFQRSNGIYPDGMIDDDTLRLLEQAAAKSGNQPGKG